MAESLAAFAASVREDALAIVNAASRKETQPEPIPVRVIYEEEFELRTDMTDRKTNKRRRESTGGATTKKKKFADILSTFRSLPPEFCIGWLAEKEEENFSSRVNDEPEASDETRGLQKVDELQEIWNRVTRAYEAASQSLERILEKSGGVEAEAQRRIAGMTSEIEEIKKTIEQVRQQVTETVNAVDDSAFGEERRAETVEQLSKKLFDAGIELPTVATPSDDPVQVFKQALATKLKECEVSLRTLQQQKAALKEKVPSEAEERAEKEVLATQIEQTRANISKLRERKQEMERIADESAAPEESKRTVSADEIKRGLQEVLVQALTSSGKRGSARALLLTCLQENDDQMGLQKLKTTLKEQGVNSVDTSKALYSLEEEGFICVDRSKRPTTVKLLMK